MAARGELPATAKYAKGKQRQQQQQQNEDQDDRERNREREKQLREQEAGIITTTGPKSYVARTIWGQAIINCRTFSIDTPKTYEFIGSWTNVPAIPTFATPEVAFIGRSNVGKSSLLNCLSGKTKAIARAGKTPGRTQCVNMFQLADRQGDIAVLVDLPGYGYAKIDRQRQEQISEFLQEYIATRGPLRTVVMLVDARRDVQDYDRGMLDYLDECGLQYVVVATKTDKLGRNELHKSLSRIRQELQLPVDQPLPFSSITGDGRRALWGRIRDGLTGGVDVTEGRVDIEEDDSDLHGDEEGEVWGD